MTDSLTHRGPDGAGVCFDAEFGIGLGHRRLAILDLSEAGSQPMWSASGRFCITYNGEVYNAPELRAELEDDGVRPMWRGRSDTEVVLEAIEAWGLRKALTRFRGMFAFALWDRRDRQLSIARDRLGIKPLLYAQGSYGVVFASELRALYSFAPFAPRLDRAALASFFRYAAVPGDECIVAGVRKLKPGSVVTFQAASRSGDEVCYWSAERVARDGMLEPFSGDEQDAVDELQRKIRESVMLRMRSDVPFGAFLSGGIDSSTVVAVMQQISATPVKTFCIGNTLAGYDESAHAHAVARHLGCEHHTLVAEPRDMIRVVPEIATHWDEPFADSSQIPTFLVSRMTRAHVTVALSGDGGDELFAGYNRHAWVPRLWGVIGRLPRRARKALSALEILRVDDWDQVFRLLGLARVVRLPGDKLYKVAALANADSALEFYERLRSHWLEPGTVLDAPSSPRAISTGHTLDAPLAEQLMLSDLLQYLPDDILTKVDRASMSVSLEARVPLLDHEVVELAWQLPIVWKIRGRAQKWILRRVLERYVPATLVDRPKMGFGVPVGQWLRGPLRDWAEDLLNPKELLADGILDAGVVAAAWRAHQAGVGNHEHRLWTLLMFQSWWRANVRHVEA